MVGMHLEVQRTASQELDRGRSLDAFARSLGLDAAAWAAQTERLCACTLSHEDWTCPIATPVPGPALRLGAPLYEALRRHPLDVSERCLRALRSAPALLDHYLRKCYTEEYYRVDLDTPSVREMLRIGPQAGTLIQGGLRALAHPACPARPPPGRTCTRSSPSAPRPRPPRPSCARFATARAPTPSPSSWPRPRAGARTPWPNRPPPSPCTEGASPRPRAHRAVAPGRARRADRAGSACPAAPPSLSCVRSGHRPGRPRDEHASARSTPRRRGIAQARMPPVRRRFLSGCTRHRARDEPCLREARGLAPATILNYVPFVRALLEHRFGTDQVVRSALRAGDVVGFVQHQAPGMNRKRAELTTTALRSFVHHVRHCDEGLPDVVAAAASSPTGRWIAFRARSRPSLHMSTQPGQLQN